MGKAVIREISLRFHDPCPRENGGKEPTPNPSQEGNNPCHPVTRSNKMKIPIQSSWRLWGIPARLIL